MEPGQLGAPGNYQDVVMPITKVNGGVWGKTLDVGCNTAWLAEFVEDYTGIDSDLDAVLAARRRWSERFAGQVDSRILHGTIESAALDAGSFHTIIVKDVIEHVDDPLEVFEKLLELLEPGGLLFLSSPDAQRWVWSDPTHKRPYPITAHRWLERSFPVETASSGFEPVVRGTQHVARRFNNRTPVFLRLFARSRLCPRNVVSIFRKVGE